MLIPVCRSFFNSASFQLLCILTVYPHVMCLHQETLSVRQQMWVLWHCWCVLTLTACLHLCVCDVLSNWSKKLYIAATAVFSLTTCLKLCPAPPDASLSHRLKKDPAREEWSQRPLFINMTPTCPAHYDRHSSTPLHNSKILPFNSIDCIPCSVACFSLLLHSVKPRLFCSECTQHRPFCVPCSTSLSQRVEVLLLSKDCNLLC